MICGFDYGTSNCALGLSQGTSVQLVPLEGQHAFLPSTLYALDRDLITESVIRGMHDIHSRHTFAELRQNALTRAKRARYEEDIADEDQTLFFGRAAFDEYFQWPEEGYFVKSPKSFLGGAGLRTEHIHFFEDVVTVMMQNIKQRAEKSLGAEITHTVIGRPVNFQGLDADVSNRQALEILTTAGKRAGFKEIEFLYEPIAAGLDFEVTLTEDKTVLVVDIGGGTTDCAMVRMGPDYLKKEDRRGDFLAHTGERIGGNDLDIQIAGKHLMPLFGMGSLLKTGLPMPTQMYWNAITTNDVSAIATFNSLATKNQINQLRLDAAQPKLIERFLRMREEKHNYHIVRSAEEAKIALSDAQSYLASLDYIEAELAATITRDELAKSIASPLEKMLSLMMAAIAQAGEQPDLIYMTGGSAKSPVIRAAIQQRIGDIPVLDGDHFGSVAAGLTVWADRIFK
ncbi:molecular chaperone [Marinomonas sp. M1K-6]|uniref:Molecular chaperone n=1 Tax=Marinomonas profundi TaxID=2726122 RepID=A0A847R3A7_9GAMM|nr:molecular chaperone [Marinomonas profundi]NLQ16853.1 molecular chaperone [Marinomonas profundi]UDV02584.1 molecular chaperone [Marinomonas profundi]